MKRRIKPIGVGLFLFITSLLAGCAGTREQEEDTLQFVSIDEELSLGKKLTEQAGKQLPLIRNPEVTQFFDKIAREIGAQSDWTGLDYKVYIVNEPDLDHFSLPGGSIYIFRGLIGIADNASEIAMIIAHEVAHLASRDAVQRVAKKYTYAFAAQEVVGDIPEIAYQIISSLYSSGSILDYPEDAEYFADQRAIKYAWKANYDPEALAEILEKLRDVEETDPKLVALLLTTHPPTSNRYKKVKMELAQTPRKSTLRKDLPEFQHIKEILQKIPR
ncbi:MAG: M48 family metalloprotease [Calditrichaeota bacterium]|nr:M48 family metalloprotease [Calditrichota bacterium]